MSSECICRVCDYLHSSEMNDVEEYGNISCQSDKGDTVSTCISCKQNIKLVVQIETVQKFINFFVIRKIKDFNFWTIS